MRNAHVMCDALARLAWFLPCIIGLEEFIAQPFEMVNAPPGGWTEM